MERQKIILWHMCAVLGLSLRKEKKTGARVQLFGCICDRYQLLQYHQEDVGTGTHFVIKCSL